MKNLSEMCCAACAEKVSAIELRAALEATPVTMAEAFADRRELLGMVEALLGAVAVGRERARLAEAILHKLLLPPTEPRDG